MRGRQERGDEGGEGSMKRREDEKDDNTNETFLAKIVQKEQPFILQNTFLPVQDLLTCATKITGAFETLIFESDQNPLCCLPVIFSLHERHTHVKKIQNRSHPNIPSHLMLLLP